MGCGKIVREVLAADIAVVNGLHRTALVILDTTALANPFEARTCEPPLDVDRHGGVGIGAGRIVDGGRRVGGGSGEDHLANGDAQLPGGIGGRGEPARGRKRARGDFWGGDGWSVGALLVAPLTA